MIKSVILGILHFTKRLLANSDLMWKVEQPSFFFPLGFLWPTLRKGSLHFELQEQFQPFFLHILFGFERLFFLLNFHAFLGRLSFLCIEHFAQQQIATLGFYKYLLQNYFCKTRRQATLTFLNVCPHITVKTRRSCKICEYLKKVSNSPYVITQKAHPPQPKWMKVD